MPPRMISDENAAWFSVSRSIPLGATAAGEATTADALGNPLAATPGAVGQPAVGDGAWCALGAPGRVHGLGIGLRGDLGVRRQQFLNIETVAKAGHVELRQAPQGVGNVING